MGCHFLLQGIFSTQRLNRGLLHCRWILYHLHGIFWPRDLTKVSCIAGGDWTGNPWARTWLQVKTCLLVPVWPLESSGAKAAKGRQRAKKAGVDLCIQPLFLSWSLIVYLHCTVSSLLALCTCWRFWKTLRVAGHLSLPAHLVAQD